MKKAEAAKNPAVEAYQSIIEEFNYRGWFKHFEDLTIEVRVFFYVLFADNEISNGGFAAYFYNGYGQYAQDSVNALVAIGAPKKAALLARIMAAFPDGKYPKTSEEYDDLLEAREDDLDFLNEDLEQDYYHSGENIDTLMVEYINKNYSVFAP